ncbi:hypothetical protein [Burkholderia sp. Bp8963]|uniref:hypothetical protein n=1 Tax=Burkholderia sp. Bp8963 TaxID=2184547 RepID=UPI000F5A87DC|nr:hypothetical protein [Burkholderia sp. Bp8963]
MTVDIVGSGPLNTDDIAAMLGEAPLELTVTLFHMAVISNPAATLGLAKKDARDTTDELPIARPAPRLTLVRDITHHIARPKRD